MDTADLKVAGDDKISSSETKTSKQYVNYEPKISDLAYLLHDKSEDIYHSDHPTTLMEPTYIVNKLDEYGKECIPLKVYVSALLRTWETAVLLYLPFLYNETQIDYYQTLILEVSPFLLEEDETSMYKQNSNKPLDFVGNVKEFFNFIKLFIYFIIHEKKDSIDKSKYENYLKKIPKSFNIILIAGKEIVSLRIHIDESGKKASVEKYSSSSIKFDNPSITIHSETIKILHNEIISKITAPDLTNTSSYNTKYESYSTDRLTKSGNTKPPTIYTTFFMNASHFNSFEDIAKFRPDIFSFLKWVIEIKSHPKNIPILFVSHSKTMNTFLIKQIDSLRHDYNNTDNTDLFPTSDFIDVCEKSRKTNTWSMRFAYLGYYVTGFRHAQSCDNMYKILGDDSKIQKIKMFVNRETYGNYTNLSLWGIFSTLIFVDKNKDNISDFKKNMEQSGLLIISGMDQQSKDSIKKFSESNELTCGDVKSRFSLTNTTSDTDSFTLTLTISEIKKFVNVIPPSMPLQEMSVTDRQKMSNEICCLNNIFKIEFIGCSSDGCEINVKYIGNYYFSEFISGKYKTLSANDKQIIDRTAERKVNIKLNKQDTKSTKSTDNFVVTLQNVLKGGLSISGVPKQREISIPRAENFYTQNNKKNISIEFKNSVGFLMGIDVVLDKKVKKYDTLYNIIILYSNLLIRQLRNIYLLTSGSLASSPNLTRITGFIKDTENLYGGNNDEKQENKSSKHKKNKKNNKT
jgi:hypothetical protein